MRCSKNLGDPQTKTAPPKGRRSGQKPAWLGGLLLLDRRLAVGDSRDFDLAGLQGLGHATDQLDMEQAVHKVGRVDLDMVGKLEPALESAAGDAAMQELRAFGLRLGLAL